MATNMKTIMNKHYAIVDVQGFKTDDNRFILKEIAILSNNRLQVFLIKPPFPYYELTKTERRQVLWIERNRGIYWKEGFVTYLNCVDYISNILKNKHIYTKGLEKVKWIKKTLGIENVNNIEDKNCPCFNILYDKYKDSNIYFYCFYHSKICALKNVFCIFKWCNENKLL